MSLAESIKQKALEIGFDLVGITDAAPIDNENINHLTDSLRSGFMGRMTWMQKNLEKRTNPAKLLPGAKSVIVVGLNYKPPSSSVLCPPASVVPLGSVTHYAQYEDYHTFIKKLLRELAGYIADSAGSDFEFKICVDSAPLLERALAVRAGLGFIGKNHMLINPQLGPQILLGELLTTLELETEKIDPDSGDNGCHSCERCTAACPTGALRPDGRFDATKCISYLTIEYKDNIPSEFASKIGRRLFGCCECLLACPYQQNAPSCANKDFKFYTERGELNLNEILALTEDQFNSRFADSPILRPGLTHLKNTARLLLSLLPGS